MIKDNITQIRKPSIAIWDSTECIAKGIYKMSVISKGLVQ